MNNGLDAYVDWCLERPGTSRFASIAETKLHYLEWDGPPGAQPLVLVHGFMGHAHWWDFVAPALASDHRVLALDLSGMGDSGRRPAYSLDLHVAEIAGLLQALAIGPVTLIGHSFGGRCTILTAYAHPELISHAIAIDSHVSFPKPDTKPRVDRPPSKESKRYSDLDHAVSRFRLVPEESGTHPRMLEHTARNALKREGDGWSWKFDPAIMHRGPKPAISDARALPLLRVPLDYVCGQWSRVGIARARSRNSWSDPPRAGTDRRSRGVSSFADRSAHRLDVGFAVAPRRAPPLNLSATGGNIRQSVGNCLKAEKTMRGPKQWLMLGVALGVGAMTGTAWAAGGGSMSGGSSNMDMPEQRMTPEQLAKQSYNSGVRRLKDATEYDADAAKATDAKKVAKANDKARKAYERALKDFTRATKDMPTMHEAWNYVGYAERHLGNYDASLAAYAKALALRPNYPEAIEYRGEAFLGLNAIDDAKQAYLALARSSPALAKELLGAMNRWVAQKRDNPAGVDTAMVQTFETWVREQEATAGKSASLAPARW